MNYQETPEDIVQKAVRLDFEKENDDVGDSVECLIRFASLINTAVKSEFSILGSKLPDSFFYKEEYALPVATTSHMSETQYRTTVQDCQKVIKNKRYDYCVNVRLCYGLFSKRETSKKQKKAFVDRVAEYYAIRELIISQEISTAKEIDSLLPDYRICVATLIDLNGKKYQILLNMNRYDEFSAFIEENKNRILNLNHLFDQDYVILVLNENREYENIEKSEFTCVPPEEFAISRMVR